ncbi:Lys5 [Kluyveromyces lactis]|nr:Lys5 [Kluyveromyces lactis]
MPEDKHDQHILHIFICDFEDGYLKDSFNFEIAMRLLPFEAQDKVLRKRSDKLQRMALTNRLLQLYGCSIVTGENLNHLIFGNGPFGKPMLLSHKGIEFSMSNGEQSCVMAVQETEVGIDIASTIDCNHWDAEYLDTFQDIFTDQEFKTLKESSSHRDELFTLYWSMKESYMKLIGTGLNTNIKAIDIGEIPEPLQELEVRSVKRKINGRYVMFISRWINKHEIVTTSTFLLPQTPFDSYNAERVDTKQLITYLSLRQDDHPHQ